jgi:hypothetical protein
MVRIVATTSRIRSTVFGTFRLTALAIGFFPAGAIPVIAADRVNASSLNGKVLLGYQGWFDCPTVGDNGTWHSWFRGTPGPQNLTVDMYPDLREFDVKQLCAVPGMTIGGKPAYLYSARVPEVVLRHFQWMKEYGIEGVLVQRFVGDIARRRSGGDVVLKNVIAAAEQTGRTFAIEYDITGGKEDTFFQVLQEDWKYLVDVLKVTSNPRYLHHNGKPVLSIWGMGLNEPSHPPEDPEVAKRVIRWFKSGAGVHYAVTYMGGTPARWRTLSADSRTGQAWAEVYRMMDIVQPWTVGRYHDDASVDQWKSEVLEGDVAQLKTNSQLYMPVVFPGFSWANLMRGNPARHSIPNQIPRKGGEFLWRQAFNARTSGATILKIAMFDEVNEGTAMFKIAPHRKNAPDQGFWLTLDTDGYNLPSDWYLRLAGEITRVFHGEIRPTAAMPLHPTELRSDGR